MKRIEKIKSGAASFYIVVFSTLILMVVVVSFMAIVSNEMTRSSNDDLSQSAYDSAMAGIEDAKLAYFKYMDCSGASPTAPTGNANPNCSEIAWYMDSDDEAYKNSSLDKCKMVEYILGKDTGTTKSTNVGNESMQQEYTCVKIDAKSNDVKKAMVAREPVVVKPRFVDNDAIRKVAKIEFNWVSAQKEVSSNKYFGNNNELVFPKEKQELPVVSLMLIQSAETFTLEQFDEVEGEKTNRGMIYLVPTFDNPEGGDNYILLNGEIGAMEGFVNSNDRMKPNEPYAVKCEKDTTSEYYCSATINIPEPIGGIRSDGTFAFVVSLPYGGPETDFSMKFMDKDGNLLYLKGQVNIDSTGRANDLYRRLSVRLEEEDDSYLIFNPLELTDSKKGVFDDSKIKSMIVTKEWGKIKLNN